MHPNTELIALGIRQPWAELILRGIKTLEIRSRNTDVRGTIYVYSSKKPAATPAAVAAAKRYKLDSTTLPLGVLVGTVEIVGTVSCRAVDAPDACVPQDVLQGQFGWKLEHPLRLEEPLVPRFLPYGVWFYPFRRRNGATR